MNNQRDNEVYKILEFLKQSELSQQQGISPSTKSLSYVLSHIGRLFVNEYRIIEFLPHNLLLFAKALIYNQQQRQFIVMRIQSKNKLKQNRALRLKIYEKLFRTITNLPLKGTYSALILYIENLSYSLLSIEQLKTSVSPVVHHLKHMQFFEEIAINCKPKQIDCKHAGTLLHSLMEFYIAGCGWINNESIIRQLHCSKLLYNPLRAIQTVNFIIGLQMIRGGYQMIATEKLLQTTNLLADNRTNFNRLDLVLRNEDKVLVIDWKFSVEKARDYLKGYRPKIQKYLTLARKYYDCEVQFHLYCIHSKDNGFLYQYTTQTIHKRIDIVLLKDGSTSEEEDMWVIESESKLKETQEMQPIKFQLCEKQLSQMCVDDYINMHIQEEINKQINQQQIPQEIQNLNHQEILACNVVQKIKYRQDSVVQEFVVINSCVLKNVTQNQNNSSPLKNIEGNMTSQQKIGIQKINSSLYQQPVLQASIIQQCFDKQRKITLHTVIQMLECELVPFQKQKAKKGDKNSVSRQKNNKNQLIKTKQKQSRRHINQENKKQQQQRQILKKPPVFIDLEEPVIIQLD